MSEHAPEIAAARSLVSQAEALIGRAQAFQQLPANARQSVLDDLQRIRSALGEQAGAHLAVASTPAEDPYALALDTPEDFLRMRAAARRQDQPPAPQSATLPAAQPEAANQPSPRTAATDTIARRTGALVDEINFPAFVAGLVHGAFDAIVDATIRQMEAFAELVGAVAKDVDTFTRENITPNQVRDWLSTRYPGDLEVVMPQGPGGGTPMLRVRAKASEDGEVSSPPWLADYGLEGQPLTDDLVENQLIPAARRSVGESRMQMLATMVLMGMSRVNVKDGSISARVRFRAVARDKAHVDYATSSDPGGGQSWGSRGSAVYDQHATMVSTVGVNVQADSELRAELFGEVKINFASETLPLERFVDAATMTLLQRHARPKSPSAEAPASGPAASVPPTNPPPASAPALVANAPAAPPATPPGRVGNHAEA